MRGERTKKKFFTRKKFTSTKGVDALRKFAHKNAPFLLSMLSVGNRLNVGRLPHFSYQLLVYADRLYINSGITFYNSLNSTRAGLIYYLAK